MNNELLDTYQLKSLDAVIERPVEKMKIRRVNGKYHLSDDKEMSPYSSMSNVTDNASLSGGTSAVVDNFPLREPYDRIIRCLGFKFNESLFSQ